MHESRHRHAMRRPRGPGGRFLTAAEIAEMRNKDGGTDLGTESLDLGSEDLSESQTPKKA